METTEKIVEAYVRYVKNWATIPNIRCDGQHEIDLIAINPQTLERYHIETSISISPKFSMLTANTFDAESLKVRIKKPVMRRMIGYFVEAKFNVVSVINRLAQFGFAEGKYARIIVTWGWTQDAEIQAKEFAITLWDFRIMMREIAENMNKLNAYFTDDTLRTLQLYVGALKANKPTKQAGRAAHAAAV